MTEWDKYFYYDTSSVSCLRWKISRGSVKFGDSAGTVYKNLYFRVQLRGKLHTVHRIIWEMSNGKIGFDFEIDHINRITTDNRLSNLRKVSSKINCRNRSLRCDSKTSSNGVTRRKRELPSGTVHECWIARCQLIDGNREYKEFSVRKFGEGEAKRLALEYYNYIRLLDGNYTENHGK